jgi:coenzyme F420-reducing hydrogenase delta subunit
MSERTANLICFSCTFSWAYLADRADLARRLPGWTPVACTGKVDPEQILQLFRDGVDGVLILGCPDEECHFQEGNYQLRKRMELLRSVLAAHRIDPRRLEMLFARDPEGSRLEGLLAEAGARLTRLARPGEENGGSA